jgi:hypothetical protein
MVAVTAAIAAVAETAMITAAMKTAAVEAAAMSAAVRPRRRLGRERRSKGYDHGQGAGKPENFLHDTNSELPATDADEA